MATPQELGNHLAKALNTGDIDIALALIQELVTNDAEINIEIVNSQSSLVNNALPVQIQSRPQHPVPFDVQQHMSGQQFYPTSHNMLLDSSNPTRFNSLSINPQPARKAQPSMPNGTGMQAYAELPRNYMQAPGQPQR